MSDKNNSLVNIDLNSKIVEKAYDDIISEPGKKIGNALGTIINVGNTLLWPIKWANERTRIYFENNLKKYNEKLSKIDDDKIMEVPTEISMPILERFTYVSNKEISEAFVKLLTSSSNIETIKFVHPSFIQIIDRLSPDEAKIIKLFSEKNAIPHISFSKYDIKEVEKERNGVKTIEKKINYSKYQSLVNKKDRIVEYIELTFKENTRIYMNNLISLGLINDITSHTYVSLEDEIELMKKELIENYEVIFNDIPEELKSKSQKFEKGMYELTEFGKLFIKSSIE
ncbi:MAG: hypothetical protein CSA36_07595 [Draconibacterium sp.]|nr:MAG: hypothetical protein CSA36_07595 [Draconibacterium sp.]